MKASTILAFLLPAAAVLAAEAPEAPTAVVEVDPASSLITPAPSVTENTVPLEEASEEALEAREIVTEAATAQGSAVTQVGSVTTYWPATYLANGQVEYLPVTYTQTFASVPDQWASPSSGTIGLGTLTASSSSSSSSTTKAVKARSVSEGTLGQTPWIGMAVGLTCTALAAVMLG